MKSASKAGSGAGVTFFALKAAGKVAVDPGFRFDPIARAEPTAQFFAMTSDEWFAQTPVRPMFEVIYIDGLHTQEQTLRDLLNATERLVPDGVIIIDDVIPSNPEAALPDQAACYEIRDQQGNPSRAWMGDVFRLLYFIETFMQSWTFEVVSENHGQAVLWRAPRAQIPERPLDSVARKSYDDLVADMARQRQPLASISERYAAQREILMARLP
ncbi:class I SAM-dependent methyltransferase [Thalassovita sp.]|uniref:class I SAM-dependent methyltransferase n=1 Tax=Thalassovita sp. TaxID=1979401 RepID=UPI002B271E53|nr:class I SAM-dependent methyltransferase [Thalassovita sp.]